jgi:hypothetical protein
VKTAFDEAWEQVALSEEAELYELRWGEPGTVAYRAGWLRFRQRIKAGADLRCSREDAAAQSRERAAAPPWRRVVRRRDR